MLSVSSAPARSRVDFSNIWGFVAFVMLHVWRSGTLFSDSPWPSVLSVGVLFFPLSAPVFYFPVCGAFLCSVLGVALGCLGLPFGSPGPAGPGDRFTVVQKSVPMQRGARFAFCESPKHS